MPLSTGATWPALANRTASAADVNNKFAWLEGHRLPMVNGLLTTTSQNIGHTLYKWDKGYFDIINFIGASITTLNIGLPVSAWMKGTTAGGTTTVDASYNISSIVTGSPHIYNIYYSHSYTTPSNPICVATPKGNISINTVIYTSTSAGCTVVTQNFFSPFPQATSFNLMVFGSW